MGWRGVGEDGGVCRLSGFGLGYLSKGELCSKEYLYVCGGGGWGVGMEGVCKLFSFGLVT